MTKRYIEPEKYLQELPADKKERISITIDTKTAEKLRSIVGKGNISRFLNNVLNDILINMKKRGDNEDKGE